MSEHPPLRQLNEYACGSLDEIRRIELAGHIDACLQCAEEVEASQIFDSAVRAGLRMFDSKISTTDCLPPGMLADYFDGSLSAEHLAAADRHLLECPSCRESLVEMRAILEKQRKGELAELDEKTGERTLDLLLPPALICMACRQPNPTGSKSCSQCGATIAPPKKNPAFAFARRQSVSELIRAHAWLILSLGAMTASFFFGRYFIQCTAIALILGAKWIFDRAQYRIFDKILKSLKSNIKPKEKNKTRRRKAL